MHQGCHVAARSFPFEHDSAAIKTHQAPLQSSSPSISPHPSHARPETNKQEHMLHIRRHRHDSRSDILVVNFDHEFRVGSQHATHDPTLVQLCLRRRQRLHVVFHHEGSVGKEEVFESCVQGVERGVVRVEQDHVVDVENGRTVQSNVSDSYEDRYLPVDS